MTGFWIMAACLYPVLLILYAVVRYEAKPRSGMLFGAQLLECWTLEPEIKEINRRFRRELHILLAVLAPLPLALIAIPYFSINIMLWTLWLCAAIVLLYLPFVRANRAVRNWKAARGFASGPSQEILVELTSAQEVRRAGFLPFLPSILVSAAAVIALAVGLGGQGLGVFTGVAAGFALCTPLFYGAAVLMDRQRLSVISPDSEVNRNYNRAKRQLWKNFWLFCAWVNTAVLAAFAAVTLALGFDVGIRALLWASVLYTALLAGVCFLIAKTFAIDKAYRDRMELIGRDEDDCWLGGIIYCNPRDRRYMVENRVGIGTTVNLATVAGKVTVAAVAVVLLLCILLPCCWLFGLETTPIRLTVTGNTLVAEQLKEDYVIAQDSIEDLALVETLPGMTRVNGTGMDDLCKGTYRLQDTGAQCQVFFNPENSLFLTFTSGGVLYYMSAADDAGTLAVYQRLSGAG